MQKNGRFILGVLEGSVPSDGATTAKLTQDARHLSLKLLKLVHFKAGLLLAKLLKVNEAFRKMYPSTYSLTIITSRGGSKNFDQVYFCIVITKLIVKS